MSHIYVVTAGEYDDYHIVMVCDSKTKAESIAHNKYINGETAYVEEWPINSPGSLSRYTENQIQFRKYDPDREGGYISDYLTGDEHYALYMDYLHERLEEQKKHLPKVETLTTPCFSTSMPIYLTEPTKKEEE